MRTIYIDVDFRCHVANDGTMTPVETDYFDGKCDKFVEGHRYVPINEKWIREDGACFSGMISPWKDMRILQAYQEQYEESAVPADVMEKAAAYDILMKGESV